MGTAPRKTKAIRTTALLGLLTALAAQHAIASPSYQLFVTAVVRSSATLTLTDDNGPASTLTFAGSDGQSQAPSEGTITVSVAVSTERDNADTYVQVEATDLRGEKSGDTIPASSMSAVPSSTTDGVSWQNCTLSNDWTTVAKLTPGSGVYTGQQTYTLHIPPNAPDDTYHGTITYQVFGF